MAVKRKTGVCSQTSLLHDNLIDKLENPDSISVLQEASSFDTGTNGMSLDKDDEETDKFPAVEDDLPLGSDANTLVSEMFGNKFSSLIDKRIAMLRSPHAGGVSFESNNTSSSSINSVDMLLQERSEDPEQVLLNLGFGSTHNEMGNTMGRIPERFLLNQSHARGINLEEFLEDNPELKTFVGMLKKKGSRSGAWKAARSISSVLYGLKLSVSSAKQKAALQPDLQDNLPKSILIPENQRALAEQGFYTQHLSMKRKGDHMAGDSKLTEERLNLHTQAQNTAAQYRDAATKRKMFQRTHSKKVGLSQDADTQFESSSTSFDYNQSIDFSTSNSIDSLDSPYSPDFRSSISDLRNHFQAEALNKMEDAYFPFSTSGDDAAGISDMRKKQVDNFLAQVDDDGDYAVSPSVSKQSTVERVKTLSVGSADDESVSHKVQIVVSVDSEDVPASAGDKVERKVEFENLNFLSIGSLSSDRLSDTESSSDHTVVDKQSITSLDSPDVYNSESVSEFLPFSEKEFQETSFVHSPDENDNFPLFKFSKAPTIPEAPLIKSPCLRGDDLTRMGSVQSDSSGFGDADNSADVTPHEAEVPRISNPSSLGGSSSESAATLASSVSTILARELLEKDNSMQSSLDEGQREDVNEPVFSWKKVVDKSVTTENLTDELFTSTSNHSRESQKETYISMCYIPISGKTKQIKETSNLAMHRPEMKAVDNQGMTVIKSETCVECKEEIKSETCESLYTDRKYGVPFHTILQTDSPSSQISQISQISPNSQIKPNSQINYDYNCTPEISQSWLMAGSRRAQFLKSRFEFDSGDSILSESDFSYCSTPESVASCNNSEMMEYSKLIKLINQPVSIQGYKRSIIQYKPKKHVKEWSNLIRKKRLQEETCMLQYAVQKYKTELHSLETAFIIQFQQAYEELTIEERDEVEELQHLWTAIHQQLLETERLLSQRMKKINSGNDFFTYISSLNILQKMILLLREQLYQQQVTVGKEEVDLANQSHLLHYRSQSYSCLDVPISSFSSQHRLNPHMPARLGQSLDELRDSIIKDVKEEVRIGTQHLHLNIQSKENEIKRLQFELMMEKYGQSYKTVQETDV